MNKVLSVSVASLVSCLFLFSCQMQCNTCEFQSITIDLDEHTVELQRLSLIKDIRIVRLETNDSVLVGLIDKVLIHDGKIYIGDFYASQSLFIFDMQGKAIRKISRKGRGPGEYIQLRDFFIDDQSGTLNLLTRNSSEILSFDLDGTSLISQTELPKELVAICPMRDGVVGYAGGYAQDGSYELWILDENYKVVRGDILIEKGWESMYYNDAYAFSSYDGVGYFLAPRENLIYSCSEKGATPLFRLNFGKYGWPEQVNRFEKLQHLDPNEANGFVQKINCFQQTERYWVFYFVFEGQPRLLVYDKQTRASRLCEPVVNETKYFLPFGRIRAISQQAIITEISALNMKPFVDGRDEYNDFEKDYPEQTARLRQIIPSIEVDDNPCLIIYQLNP